MRSALAGLANSGTIQGTSSRRTRKEPSVNGDVSDRKRLVAITKGNIAHKHIYISSYHDFFPSECYGKSNAKSGRGQKLELFVQGLADPIETDISKDAGNNRPRNFFRKRGWVRTFFARHNLRPGSVVAVERMDKSTHQVCPFETKNVRRPEILLTASNRSQRTYCD